jgi:hypothetical protein
MKVFVSLGKVENCPYSRKNAVNPVAVGIFNPADGRKWDRGLLLDSTVLKLWPSVAVAVL